MNKATNVKKQILASQIAYKRTQNNEVQLEKALAKFFNKLKKEVLNALDEYWKDYQMLQGHIDLICAPVHEAHKEYYELLTLYIKREYRLGSAEAKRLVRLANSKQRVASKSMRMPVRAIIKKDNDLFGTLPSAEERLLNRTFTASERTLSRVDSQINQIITDGYRSGKGINDVANSLNQRFDQLTSWESKRIARTEIHNSHNTAVMDTYQELGVEYTMWIAAEDERTRDSHLEINGEIIPMGGTYSNGLGFPGDTSGPIEEWINCRCSNAPFVIPYGYMAPSFSPFRESDLIKVETKDFKEIVEETQEEAQSQLPSESPTTITTDPIEEVNRMSSNDLYESMTKTDKAKYDKARSRIENARKYSQGDMAFFRTMTEKDFKTIRELEQKQKDKLIKKLTKTKPKVEPKKQLTKLQQKELKTFKKETPLNDFEKMDKWAAKRTKGKTEYAYSFDKKTGKIVGDEMRGGRSGVSIPDKGKDYGSLHIHTDELSSFPSDGDIKSFRSMASEDHYIVSSNEVWYVHAEENLVIMGQHFQMDIDMVYQDCIKEGNAAVEKMMRSGEIGLDEASIKKAADKEIGDRLIKEFSKPKWKEKGLEVRRAYR